MKPEDLQDLHVEQLSCWCDLWIDGVAFMFHVPLVDIGTKMQTSVRAQI